MLLLCVVYTGYYKAWFIWGGVVRVLGYLAGMSKIGWTVHTGVGNKMGRLRCWKCSVIGMRGLWVQGLWCEWPGGAHGPGAGVCG